MTNGEIHESSMEIGKLISGLKGIEREIAGLRKDMGHMEAESKTRHDRIEAEVKSLTEFKNNGKGIIFGVALAASGIGAAIKIIWDYLKGHIV
jgi:hypothetical protein